MVHELRNSIQKMILPQKKTIDHLGEGRPQAIDVVVGVAVVAEHHLVIIAYGKRKMMKWIKNIPLSPLRQEMLNVLKKPYFLCASIHH